MKTERSHEAMERLGNAIRTRFEEERRVLSFADYLDLVRAHPHRYTRDAARYLFDCFEHFGHYEVDTPSGRERRFSMFDLSEEAASEEGGAVSERSHNLVGQELLQNAFYRALTNFVQEGRANRLILLHGPNGSAKTTFAQGLMRGLESYSRTDEGALYRFSWLFPRGRDGKTIGFSGSAAFAKGASLADLPEDQLDAKLTGELREHPLLLLPVDERREFLKSIGAPAPGCDLIWSGQLGRKNRDIFEALLTAYRGDIRRVLNHVRIERYDVSRRYRLGVVTIGPQMAVDASERQITADRSLAALPASLSSLTLYESFGDLVDGAGGVIEYSDLLKRPLDAWKYLLLAIENGEVPLKLSNLTLNSVMVASSNEIHLQAFREHPEYKSFRGRLSLVRVPYLVDYVREQQIYDQQIAPQVRRHVAPHATFVAAFWAVLTRLRRPKGDGPDVSSTLSKAMKALTPTEKADLYAIRKLPTHLSVQEAGELETHADEVFREHARERDYEGLTGASPRAVRSLLLDAANDDSYACLSPRAVLDRIEQFCDHEDYEFLKQTEDGGYLAPRQFVKEAEVRWLSRVENELRQATGLIDESQYLLLFEDYMNHVSNWAKGEKVLDSVTGDYREPDESLMNKVEDRLSVEDDARDDFRNNLIGKVAARALAQPGSSVDYEVLFPRTLDKLRSSYYQDRDRQVYAIARDMLRVLAGEEGLEPDKKEHAKGTLERLYTDFGYEASSASEAVGELVRNRDDA